LTSKRDLIFGIAGVAVLSSILVIVLYNICWLDIGTIIGIVGLAFTLCISHMNLRDAKVAKRAAETAYKQIHFTSQNVLIIRNQLNDLLEEIEAVKNKGLEVDANSVSADINIVEKSNEEIIPEDKRGRPD